ncbi:MAG TPA: hypothetical protein VMS76_01465 [Planctomycetota bacterium]|nr:hypothetical protein [Planctomycetota bacterium]
MTAKGTLSLSIEFPRHSPFFGLPDPEKIRVENALVAQMVEHFPIDVQKSWGNLHFKIVEGHCIENEVRLRQQVEERLPELKGGNFSLASPEPDEWTCRIVDGRHVCERSYSLLMNGQPWIVSEGSVSSQVAITLAWQTPLKRNPPKR